VEEEDEDEDDGEGETNWSHDTPQEEGQAGEKGPAAAPTTQPETTSPRSPQSRPALPQNGFSHGSDLVAQLYANPKLAALRQTPSTLSMSPLGSASTSGSGGGNPFFKATFSPPILANPKCSGYFVEPMKWMEPFLNEGQMAGKIVCPNSKCGAKLGNYDWAGVRCSCKEWVVPGFCIHRSKVDEVV